MLCHGGGAEAVLNQQHIVGIVRNQKLRGGPIRQPIGEYWLSGRSKA